MIPLALALLALFASSSSAAGAAAAAPGPKSRTLLGNAKTEELCELANAAEKSIPGGIPGWAAMSCSQRIALAASGALGPNVVGILANTSAWLLNDPNVKTVADDAKAAIAAVGGRLPKW